MENNYYVPAQIIENNLKGAVGKANLKLYKMIMMGFFAGMFIAIGAEGSNLAVHTVDNFGLAKTLAGCIFPVGLMMLSIIGAELFTGNCMMITAVIDGKACADAQELGYCISQQYAWISCDCSSYIWKRSV